MTTQGPTELVERLRQAANGLFPPSPLGDYGVCDEAAATIESQQRLIERIGRWFEGYIANGGRHADEELALIKSALTPSKENGDGR